MRSPKQSSKGQFKRAKKIWLFSWDAFGGWGGLVLSPYFFFALIFSVALFPLWSEGKWFDISFSVIPSILGFSLGGFSIFLAFGDQRFRYMISGSSEDGEVSPFLNVCVSFFHFISIQTISIFMAMIGSLLFELQKSYVYELISFLGVLGLLYSLALVLASISSLLKLAKSFDAWVKNDRSNRSKQDGNPNKGAEEIKCK